jgi:aspartyl-tRNA(Asn)/glutamyl-tRNA(Gln) amidotransferase subunit A
VRFPAAFCGVVALKPTLGLLSNRGHTGGGDSSFSVPGPITRSVRDAATAAQMLAGFDPAYAYSRPGPVPDLCAGLDQGVRALRVGTMRDLLRPTCTPDVAAAHDATLARLEELGARLVDVRLPHHELVLPAIGAVFGLEADTLLEAMLGDRPRLFSPQVARIIANRPPNDGATWVQAQLTRQRVRQDYDAAFLEADVLVAPVAPVVAPRIDSDENAYVAQFVPYCGAANLVGFPGVALPAGQSDGLPIGIQILAPAGADARALRVAHALETAFPVHRVTTPPVAA